MSEIPRIKYSTNWLESLPTMLPGEIAVNAHTTPPTLFAGNNDGEPRPLPGIIYAASTPPRPVNGTLWINNSTGRVSYWDGTVWVTLGSAGGAYDSGDFIGWMDPLVAGGGLTPPIDGNNAPNFVDGSYVRVFGFGWYNLQTGQPVDASLETTIPNNTVYLSSGETVIKDSTQNSGWRQMEDGAMPVGKLSLHNLRDISLPHIATAYTTVTLDGADYPIVSTAPFVGSAGPDGHKLIHQFISQFMPDAGVDQQRRTFTMWPDGQMTQSPMTNWGDTADLDRPEIPGNPGHLDLFSDWAYLPKATIEAHFGGNAIIRDPAGLYNTITPTTVDDYGLIIETLDGGTNPLLIKQPDGATAFAVGTDGTTGVQGKLGVAGPSVLYGDVLFVDQTNIGRQWRMFTTTLFEEPTPVIATAFGLNPDMDAAQVRASKFSVRVNDLDTAHTARDFTFYVDGTLWLPVDPSEDVHAVRFGYIRDKFLERNPTGTYNTITPAGTGAEGLRIKSLTGTTVQSLIVEKPDGTTAFAVASDGTTGVQGKLGVAGPSVLYGDVLFVDQTNIGRQWRMFTTSLGTEPNTVTATAFGLNPDMDPAQVRASKFSIRVTDFDAAHTQRDFTFYTDGTLWLPVDPSEDVHAVRFGFLKSFTDDKFMHLTGGVDESADGVKTFTGKMYTTGIANNGYLWWTNVNDPTNKAWSSIAHDAALNQLTIQPTDHASRLQIRTRGAPGGAARNFTFRETGQLELPVDATSASHAIRKNYIDTQIVDDSTGYRMIRQKPNGSGAWVRSPTAGFLPNATGGNSSSLGTTNWRWKNIWGDVGNFNTLLVGGQPIDSSGFMDLTTDQTANGVKQFNGKLYAHSNIATVGLWLWNSNDTSKAGFIRIYDAANNIMQLYPGDYLGRIRMTTQNGVGATQYHSDFLGTGYLTLPRNATSSSHAVRKAYIDAKIIDDSQTYRGLRAKNGATNGWIRSATPGFLPYTSGGNSSSLGTSGWRWKTIYGVAGNFNTLTVGGLPIDSTGFMNLTTNQTAAGEKTFSGKMRVPGSLNSTAYISILNANTPTTRNWSFGCANATQNYLGLTGGDNLCSFYIDTKNATGGISRRFFFDQSGYLQLPRNATSSSHAVRKAFIDAKVYDDSSTYRRIRAKNGATSGWIQPSATGILPYASGGNSSDLGHASWRWRWIYGTNVDTTNLTVGNNANFNGVYLTGDGKRMLQFSDAWLRVNPGNQFTSGIYCGTATLRTDGYFEIRGSAASIPNSTAINQLWKGGRNYGAVRFHTQYFSPDNQASGVGSTGANATRTYFNTTSDRALKANIVDVTQGMAITILKSLGVREFDWKVNDEHDIGFVAQEVEDVLPTLVSGGGYLDGTDTWIHKQLDLSKFTPYLWAQNREQQDRIESLESRLAALEAMILSQ